MSIIIELIGIACFAVIFRTIVTPTLPKFMWVKPFICESCLGFWFGLGFFIQEYNIAAILPASICYFLAYKIYKL